MANCRYVLAFLILFFIAIRSMAQVNHYQLPNSAFRPKPLNRPLLFFPHKSSLVTVHSMKRSNTPFGNFVHYPAFFCQMELKSAMRLGVMVKIHAGDYDAYHDKR